MLLWVLLEVHAVNMMFGRQVAMLHLQSRLLCWAAGVTATICNKVTAVELCS